MKARRPRAIIQAELDAALALVRTLKRERASLGRAEAIAARNPARQLPGMSRDERLAYRKLRYRNGLPRDVALAAVLPSPTGPTPQPRG